MTFLGVLVTHPGYKCTHLPLVIYIEKKRGKNGSWELYYIVSYV